MASPTSRDALGYPASSAIVPYVHTEPAGTRRTCAYTRSKNPSSISIIPEPFAWPIAHPLTFRLPYHNSGKHPAKRPTSGKRDCSAIVDLIRSYGIIQCARCSCSDRHGL